MIFAVAVAAVIPIVFLYFVHWLDLYASERPRAVLICFAWGMLSVGLSYLINHPMIDIYGRPFVGTRTAPIVEEVFKSLILLYFIRRADFTYFVDGAIYGFASGTGFAIAENMLYLSRVDPETGVILATTRVFSTALMHGSATALTGIALGRFRLERGRSRLLSLLLGWTAAMTLHLTFNNIAISELDPTLALALLAGLGFAAVALVALFIFWGLRQESQWLRETLNTRLGVSEEEASIIQHMGDLDELLAPVAKRFGKRKRDEVAHFLHVEAQLGLKRQVQQKTTDAKLRAQIESQIDQMEQQLDRARRDVGVYAMSFVRSILPPTQWSIWVRADQALATSPVLVEPTVWRTMTARIGEPRGRTHPTAGMYGRVQHELISRMDAATHTPAHAHDLPEEMRHSLHWVMQREEVTLEHLAQELKHEKATAHAILTHLVERGFLDKTIVDGETRYRARTASAGQVRTRSNLWQVLEGRVQKRLKPERALQARPAPSTDIQGATA